MSHPVDRELRLAFWKLHILHHATRRPVYGWIARTSDTAHARARRPLRTTSEGRRVLKRLRRDVTELHDELVLGREPEHPRAPKAAARERSARGSVGRKRS